MSVPVQYCWSMNWDNRSPGVGGWFPWFWNGISQSRVHPETLQTTCYLVLPSPLPCSILERKIEDKTSKDHRLRYEQFFWKLQWNKTMDNNSNDTEDSAEEKRRVMHPWLLIPSNTWPLPLPHYITQKGAFPNSPENDVRWYRITSQVFATAKN